MTLEAVPPGQQPTKMTPNAKSAGREKTFVNSHAISGMMVNCARQPVSTSLGRLKTTRKSCGDKVRPMPNMISPNIGLTTQVPTDINGSGTSTASRAASNTNAPIHRAIKSQSFFILTSFFNGSNASLLIQGTKVIIFWKITIIKTKMLNLLVFFSLIRTFGTDVVQPRHRRHRQRTDCS